MGPMLVRGGDSAHPSAIRLLHVSDVFSQKRVLDSVARVLRDAAWAARRRTDKSAGASDAPAVSDAAMTHAWVFTGPPGAGRTVAAQAFAAALQCEHPSIAGCGQCEQCRAVLNGSHPDVSVLATAANVISVDTVREKVVSLAATLPTQGAWRVVIIAQADRMEEPAASALLKSVEEPAERSVIIMCAPSVHPAEFFVTLRSRSRVVYVPTPPPAVVAEILQRTATLSDGSPVPAEIAHLAAAATMAHVGRARGLVSSSATQEFRRLMLDMAEMLYRGDEGYRQVARILQQAEQAADAKLQPVFEAERQALETSLGMGGSGKAVAAARGNKSQLTEMEHSQKQRRRRAISEQLDLGLTDLSALFRDALRVQALWPDPAQPLPAAIGDDLVHVDYLRASSHLAAYSSAVALLECIDIIAATRRRFADIYALNAAFALNGMVGRLRLALGIHT